MLDDHSHEMSCFQNKSINLFLLQRRKVDRLITVKFGIPAVKILFWSTKFKADILLVLRKLSGTDFLPYEA